MLTHVQTLWELMLLGEPLVVLAPSPDVSSELVLALTRYKLYSLDCVYSGLRLVTLALHIPFCLPSTAASSP